MNEKKMRYELIQLLGYCLRCMAYWRKKMVGYREKNDGKKR